MGKMGSTDDQNNQSTSRNTERRIGEDIKELLDQGNGNYF